MAIFKSEKKDEQLVINSIEGARTRVLAVVCPLCNAAVKALCTEKVIDAGGLQTKFTDIFHAERIIKAQTLAERAMDMTNNIRSYLNAKADQLEIKHDKSTGT